MPTLLQNIIRRLGWTPPAPERRARVIDFAYGNAVLENPRITREMVSRAYDRLHGLNAAGR